MIWWTEFVHNYDVEKVKKFKRSNVSGFWIKLNPPPPSPNRDRGKFWYSSNAWNQERLD